MIIDWTYDDLRFAAVVFDEAPTKVMCTSSAIFNGIGLTADQLETMKVRYPGGVAPLYADLTGSPQPGHDVIVNHLTKVWPINYALSVGFAAACLFGEIGRLDLRTEERATLRMIDRATKTPLSAREGAGALRRVGDADAVQRTLLRVINEIKVEFHKVPHIRFGVRDDVDDEGN